MSVGFGPLPGELAPPAFPAAPITVKPGFPGGKYLGIVEMGDPDGPRLVVTVHDDGHHVIDLDADIRSACFSTWDLRRIADTVDAVQRGTYPGQASS